MNKKFKRISIGIILMMTLIGCGIPKKTETRYEDVRIILHRQGKAAVFDNRNPYFQDVLQECEHLYMTANTGYLMIVTGEMIAELKKRILLEVAYPEVRTLIVWGYKKYITRLFIPFGTEWKNTIFVRGIYGPILRGKKPDYALASKYYGAVINTGGTERLRELLRKMGVDIPEVSR